MKNKKDNWEGFDELVRDITKVGFMAKSEARRRLKEIIDRELTHQNKRFNEECEKIVNRELKAQRLEHIVQLTNADQRETVLKAESKIQTQRIIERLEKIVEKGAPSEQDNVIKYGATIWEGIHRTIEIIKEETK